jgi:hypothetical protein
MQNKYYYRTSDWERPDRQVDGDFGQKKHHPNRDDKNAGSPQNIFSGQAINCPLRRQLLTANPGARSRKPSGFRFGCVGRGFARDFAEFARLLPQDLHLRSNKLAVQR